MAVSLEWRLKKAKELYLLLACLQLNKMKLTKKLEVEVLKFYKSYWDAYLSGDMKTFASMLDDELTVFGTAVSEVFNNKKEAVKFYHATADQLVGKAQFRNSKFKLQVVDDAVLINQQCDFYILLEKKWTFYGHARVTAILKHTKSGWKLVHQHASFPDVRAEEGEQVAANKIKEENIQLRDALKRRTIELEEKNRELEIEAALERVGTVAMSMKKPGDLFSVCKTGFKELKKLGFTDLRNMIIHTYVDDQKYFNDYDYSDALGGAISRVPYTGNPIIENFIRTIRKGTSAFSEIKITGKQLDDWKKFRKANKEANDPRLNKSKALYYYNYSVGSGSIGISTFNPVDDEKRNVLVRFRNVFDLSYRRYLDIEKAEAQAREAQIQLALERVRAKSLAMHHSSELQEVVNIAAAQLHRIGMDINGGVFICINAEVDKELPVWASGGAADYVHKAIVPFLNKPIFTRIRNAIKKGNSFLIESFSDREKRELFRHLFKHEPWRSLPQERKQELLSRKGGFARSVVISKHTSISITNHFGKSFTEEENEILKRFGKVFEQSYIRFLDLQKAEAQAREAQIEVAVERVRAKALAMHRSDEIHEVVRTLRNELFGLELEGITGATICLRQSDGQVRLWDITDVDKTGRYGWDILFDMSEIDPRLWVKRIWNARKKIIAVEQDSNDLKRALQWLGHYNKKTAADITKLLKRNKINHGWHCAVQLANGILITDFVNESPAEIEPILLKTGAAFDLAYKRFLDLQKAEAQAREAQIEAALERVRAKSMGMRFSSELGEVIKEVTDQLYLLGFNFDTSNIGTQYDKNGFYLWNSSPEEPVLSSIYVPAKKLKIVDWFYGQKKWVAQVRSFLFGKRDTNNFFKYYLSTKDGSRIPGIRKTFLISVPSISVITAFRKDFTLSVLNYRGVKYSDEDAAILNRFANVFEQSYTRFLDLQKAESQAREAQIEVAVERVRAKALAMHKSEDLHSVVVTLKKELRGLQIPDVTAATIYLQQDDGLIRILDLSGADKADDEQVEFKMDKVFRIEDIHPKLWINRMWKRKENYFVEEADKADFDRIIDWLYTIDKSEASIAEKIIREKKIERAWLPTVKLEKGVMNIDLLQPPAPEIETILLKIGAGFDLAYKRFLDLQKAEAQAREAQIEAALEKVRSRSLAMHKSDELKEVVAVLYQKLQELDFDMDKGAAIMITYSSDSKDITQWITDATQTYAVPFFIPFTGYAIPLDQDNARKKNLPFFSRIYDRKEKNEYFRYLFKHTQYSQLPEPVQQMILDSKNFGISIALEKNSAIAIPSTIGKLVTGDEITILKRFSNVFEQCYTRFLDLQKAEAQAREAQIQLALERVRARTMAM
ncbi:MAG TPA: nuclear transport factor 2 family protein, partial [Chitinophagaceae bacterium]